MKVVRNNIKKNLDKSSYTDLELMGALELMYNSFNILDYLEQNEWLDVYNYDYERFEENYSLAAKIFDKAIQKYAVEEDIRDSRFEDGALMRVHIDDADKVSANKFHNAARFVLNSVLFNFNPQTIEHIMPYNNKEKSFDGNETPLKLFFNSLAETAFMGNQDLQVLAIKRLERAKDAVEFKNEIYEWRDKSLANIRAVLNKDVMFYDDVSANGAHAKLKIMEDVIKAANNEDKLPKL